MRASIFLVAAAASLCGAFRITPLTARSRHVACRSTQPTMEFEEVEFIIHPDGRVEERVRGIKGMACEQLTEEINKALGEVYEVKPTNEMYEQKVEVNVDAENTVSESWGSGSWGNSGSSTNTEW